MAQPPAVHQDPNGTDGTPPATPAAPGRDEDSGRSYVDPGAIVGRSIGENAHAIALAITACADLAIFSQVLSLVMAQEDPLPVYLAVAGFTACSLLLAHFAGRMLRDLAAGWGQPQKWPPLLLTAGWLTLGTTAFAVRWLVSKKTSQSSVVSGTSGTTTTASAALLFLALYIASGLVAGFGAYLNRNPLRSRYHAAVRQHRAALKRFGRARAPYEGAVSVLQLHLRNQVREDAHHAAARRFRDECAAEMRRHAALRIAAHLQDPSATSGITATQHRTDRSPTSLN
jgi:hypothetical protein